VHRAAEDLDIKSLTSESTEIAVIAGFGEIGEVNLQSTRVT